MTGDKEGVETVVHGDSNGNTRRRVLTARLMVIASCLIW